jgi:hypothetical protein
MYEETAPPPPIVTRAETFRTANFTLPVGPWYAGNEKSFQASEVTINVMARQNGNTKK